MNLTSQTSIADDSKKLKNHSLFLKTAIFRNSFRNILKSKFFWFFTPIFLVASLAFVIISSVFLIPSSSDFNSTGVSIITVYSIMMMVFIFTFNINTLVRFFMEEKQNGIYDLELRKGKTTSSIFLQRLMANKFFSIGYILLAIAIYYVAFSFVDNYQLHYLLINLLAPGLWFLLVFDTFMTAIIMLFSFFKKIKITSALATIIALFFILFLPISMMLSLFVVNPDQMSLSFDGQFSLHYAKQINEIRDKYKNGITNKMIMGDNAKTDFSYLGKDQWKFTNLNLPDYTDPDGEKKLQERISNYINSQLLFNGLIPDSKTLFSDLGVLGTDGSTYNKYISDYALENNLTAAQSTYFNNFFASKPKLFNQTGAGFSRSEWEKTIFNASIDPSDNRLIQDTLDKKGALNYLQTAIQEVDASLSNSDREEWKELSAVIEEAFKSTYLFTFRQTSSVMNYLNRNNILMEENDSRWEFERYGLVFFGTDSIYKNEYNEYNQTWTYPILTTRDSIEKTFEQDETLNNFQKEIFKHMTVKPGTRELMSMMASLLSNSLIVPKIAYSNDENQNIDAYRVKHKQDQINLYNPFGWITNMMVNAKADSSFTDKLLLKDNSLQNIGSYDATGLENYYVDLTDKEKFKRNSNNDPIELIDDDDIVNPNFNWKDIQVIKSSFSPLWAIVGSILANIALIGVSYWIFKITLIS